jgi:uncharacterized metal-binding protein YceD (DUF177 family)
MPLIPSRPSRSNAVPLPWPADGAVSTDRLARLGLKVQGELSPLDFLELHPFLASREGQIHVELSGKMLTDQLGSQQKQLRCIISGWFDVLDAATLMPTKFELDIDSRVRLFASEEELPPFEDEPDDEDFIVCGDRFDIRAHVQEEILLALPSTTPFASDAASDGDSLTRRAGAAGSGKAIGKSAQASPELHKSRQQSATKPQTETGDKPNPFAKLAALKKPPA